MAARKRPATASRRGRPTVGDALEAAARAAQARAYAPYSGFRVGAAVLADGVIFDGANVENASYGLAICAERTAIAAAVLAGHRRIEAVAVITDATPPSSPCGMCRQTMREFTPDPAAVPTPWWIPAQNQFNGGQARIREVFLALAEAYARPAAGSALIDAATPGVDVPADDILGRPRPATGADLGCYEVQAAQAVFANGFE